MLNPQQAPFGEELRISNAGVIRVISGQTEKRQITLIFGRTALSKDCFGYAGAHINPPADAYAKRPCLTGGTK
jgi:hypothetical protein